VDLKNIWRVITTPKCWDRLYPYNKDWDDKLNSLLDSGEKINIGLYTSNIGNITIWTSNYPYCFGRLYGPIEFGILPSRKTVFRLYDRILKEIINEV